MCKETHAGQVTFAKVAAVKVSLLGFFANYPLSLTANLLNSGLKVGKGLPPKIASAHPNPTEQQLYFVQPSLMFKTIILFLYILPFLETDTMSLDVYTQNIPLTQKATVNFLKNYQRKYRKDRSAKRLQRKEDYKDLTFVFLFSSGATMSQP